MERTKKILPRLLVTLIAAGTFSFGASEAFAADAAMTCPFSPPTHLGDCISPMSSNDRCQQQPGGDGDSIGTCDAGGCCVCRL